MGQPVAWTCRGLPRIGMLVIEVVFWLAVSGPALVGIALLIYERFRRAPAVSNSSVFIHST